MGEPLRVFLTREIPESALRRLVQALPGARVEVHDGPAPLERAALAERARGAAAIVCTLTDRIDRALLSSLAPTLRVVSTFAVGHENIDLEAARELGVRVAHTPGVLTDATAEVAVALLLACARRVAEGDRFTRAGRFEDWSPLAHRGQAVYGKTLGIVGAGRIGRRVAATMRRGFECAIVVHSRTPRRDWEEELGARFLSLETLLETSDFVSLHCPLTPETHHLLGAAAFERMKPSAVLVNTARGAVVDEQALVRALRARRIAGAGLDVYEDEPRLTPGLARLENVVLLPHIGSATHEARDAMGRLCVDAVIDVLSGREPAHALA